MAWTTKRRGRDGDRGQRRATRPGLERLEAICLLSSARPDIVTRWNTLTNNAVAVDHSGGMPSQGGPTKTARAMAIESLAVYDAVNAIQRKADPYLLKDRAPAGTSLTAAVAQAGHDTLVMLYPKQKAALDEALRMSLARVGDADARAKGVALGKRAARLVLANRQDDGSQLKVDYVSASGAGAFEVFPGEPAALTPGWGKVTPFAMSTASAFLAPPPPEMTSAEYAAAFNEVKDFGGDGVHTPTKRTQEQTDIGYFWAYDGTPGLGTPPRLYNQIAQVVAKQEKNSVAENARMFALINMAMADAACAGWDAKYVYDIWRPIRGIRQIDASGNAVDDGNPTTTADPTWVPLGAPCTNCPPGSTGFTPPFPAYVSGHAIFGAALFETLKNFYGTDNITFTFTSDELDGVNKDPDGTVRDLKPRTFTSFSQAAEENGQSRIYLGIHWAFDKEQGIAAGNAIADFTTAHVLVPRAAAGARAASTPR